MPNPGRPRLKDVAARAGVSTATVSMVLNKSTTRISPQTSEAVRRAAAELGYQPNLTARSLRTNRTQLIGMISDYVASSPYATGIIQGAQEAAWSREHLLLIVNTEGDTRHENDLVQALSARQVDGFLYAAMSHQECEVPVALEGQHVVGVDMHIGTAGPSFVPAESAAATTATEALLAAGHHRIGHLRGRPHATASGLRAHAFIETMRAAGCLDESLIVAHPGTHNLRDSAFGEGAARRLLSRPDRPTALFAFNDRMALGVYRAADALGLAIPRELSVVGFDDQQLIADELRPGLTTLALPHYEMGRLATLRLVDMLDTPPGYVHEPELVQLPCRLVVRDSVAPPAD